MEAARTHASTSTADISITYLGGFSVTTTTALSDRRQDGLCKGLPLRYHITPLVLLLLRALMPDLWLRLLALPRAYLVLSPLLLFLLW